MPMQGEVETPLSEQNILRTGILSDLPDQMEIPEKYLHFRKWMLDSARKLPS